MVELIDNRKKNNILEQDDLVKWGNTIFKCKRCGMDNNDFLLVGLTDGENCWHYKKMSLKELEGIIRAENMEIIKESDYKMTIELKGVK